ncbi:MAG: 2Fe-2S iron-sulfur cluster binding domain-containing protein [Spirochaetales bacterium]|nr:2Fe-2S iron-sulfur cluster binding domain-containing protein [Spirochaetales bacterium]
MEAILKVIGPPFLVMNGFVLFILLLISLLRRFIAAYGESTLTINGEKKLVVRGGQTLAQALFAEKIYIPSACGGRGTCGFCKVRITVGAGEALPIEEMLLNYSDVAAGYRLSCQTKVRNDLSLEVPEELLAIREYKGVVEDTKELTRDIKRLSIDIREPKDVFAFRSGQYVLIQVGPTETRAYSVSSSVRLKDEIQVEVKLIPNGLGSSYLHRLGEGDEVTFFGPYGQFFLQDTHHKIICVAGGVGLAPMKPIIEDALFRYPNRDVELYYGCNDLADLYDHETFIALNEKAERFSYYPALSELPAEPPRGYPIEEGFVHLAIERNLTRGEDSEAYLCGPPLMIDAVIKVLMAKGVPEIRILYDKF